MNFPVLYIVKYKTNGKKRNQFNSATDCMRNCLLHVSLIMTQFLLHTIYTFQNSFFPWLDLFIEKEKYLCSEKPSDSFTTKMYNNFDTVKKGLCRTFKGNRNRSKMDQHEFYF